MGEAVTILWGRRWQLCERGDGNYVGEAVAIVWGRQ